MQTLCIGSTLKSPPTPGCVEGPRVGRASFLPSIFNEGCGHRLWAHEDILPAGNGLGNRPKKPSLVFDHIVHHPMPLRNSSSSLGHLAKALGQARPQELGTFSTLGVQRARICTEACPLPSLATVTVLCWLEGTRGRRAQICWANTTCQDVWAKVAHMGKILDVFPPLDAINTLSLEPTGGLRVI